MQHTPANTRGAIYSGLDQGKRENYTLITEYSKRICFYSVRKEFSKTLGPKIVLRQTL